MFSIPVWGFRMVTDGVALTMNDVTSLRNTSLSSLQDVSSQSMRNGEPRTRFRKKTASALRLHALTWLSSATMGDIHAST